MDVVKFYRISREKGDDLIGMEINDGGGKKYGQK